MALESIEKLRELACDINGNEIVDHMQLYPSCVFDGAWLNSWHCEFDRELEALEREIAERYMELPVDADGVPIRVGDIVQQSNGWKKEVLGIGAGCFYDRHYLDDYHKHYAVEYSHIKKDPVKELLEEFADKIPFVWDGDKPKEAWPYDSLMDEYAARIREAVGA